MGSCRNLYEVAGKYGKWQEINCYREIRDGRKYENYTKKHIWSA